MLRFVYPCGTQTCLRGSKEIGLFTLEPRIG